MPDVILPSKDGASRGYLAAPSAGQGPGVIVLHEWWGLDGHIRSVCDRLAAAGIFALAPDLYGGETTEQPDEAEQKMMALAIDKAERDLHAAVEFLAVQEGVQGDAVGSVGFCLGGGLSVWAAAANPKVLATVTYYYVLPHGRPDFARIRGPVLGHFGTADAFVPIDEVRALERDMREAGVDVTFELYDGAGHAFFNDSNRLGTYDRALAERSWARTLEFLHEALT